MNTLFFPHSYAFVPLRKIGTWFTPGVRVQQKHHGEAFRCAADALEAWLADVPAPVTYTSVTGPHAPPAPVVHMLAHEASEYVAELVRTYTCARCGALPRFTPEHTDMFTETYMVRVERTCGCQV